MSRPLAMKLARAAGCWKRAYATESQAEAGARNSELPLSPYRCPNCKQWHLTGQLPREPYALRWGHLMRLREERLR